MYRIANPTSPVRLRVAPPVLSPVNSVAGAVLFHNRPLCPDGEIGRHIGLKIRRLPEMERTGSTPVPGTNGELNMPRYNAPFEIHVHGQVPMRADTTFAQLQDALQPLWKYAGARSLADGANSVYEEEPGIKFDAVEHMLQICWTVPGDDDFRQSLDEMCMSLNELAELGAAIEVTFYDSEFDEDDEEADGESESRDDFVMLFVGPNPAAIMQVQRDLLVQDVVNMMERHFDGAELGGVVAEIDKLFSQRFDALVNSLEIGKPPRGPGGPSGGHGGGGGRRPRHLH